MKFLTKTQMEQLDQEATAASNAEDYITAWEAFESQHRETKVILVLPNGELMNEEICGFIWAWNMKGAIQQCPIPKGARLQAHGLEGCFQVETDLITALFVRREVGPFRCAVSIIK